MPTSIETAGPRRGRRDPDPVLLRQQQRESAARTYPRRIPLNLVWGRGVAVRDSYGDEYLDCLAGAGALPLGHNHPVVVAAIETALRDELPLATLDLATPTKDTFVEQLFSVLPAELADGRIQFCGPTGADAVEAALKLAKTATGRNGVIAFGGGYHGMTHGALAVTGVREPKLPLGPLAPEVHHLPFPCSYRCPFGSPRDPDAHTSAELCARTLSWALHDGHSGIAPPAAVILEPVQGEGGVHPAPERFARSVRATTRAAGAVLVADEVQTGLGRTGALWASTAVGLDPDVLVLSKAIGGGLPLAVIVYRRNLDVWAPGAHAGTFRGNQLAMATGVATIRHVVGEGLVEHADAMGARLLDGLRLASAGSDLVGEVRGRGLMVGVELVDQTRLGPTGVPEPDGPVAARVQRAMLERGVIVELGGRADAVVRFLPPLIIQPAQVDQVVAAFASALDHMTPRAQAVTARPTAPGPSRGDTASAGDSDGDQPGDTRRAGGVTASAGDTGGTGTVTEPGPGEPADAEFLSPDPAAGQRLRRLADRAVDAVVGWASTPGPRSAIEPDRLAALVAALDPCPDHGLEFDQVVDEVGRAVLTHGVRTFDPRCVAHLHSPTLLTAAATELIIGATNQSLDSYDQAPAATLVEDHLVGWLARTLGLPADATGVLTAGGTASNLLGLLLARDHAAHPGASDAAAGVAAGGLPGRAAGWRIVTSEAAHFSVRQSAAVLGLGHRAVAGVATDSHGRMDIDALDTTLTRLRAQGLQIVAIVGTAGTTDLGAVDPLAALAERAGALEAWFHVDAAVGAAFGLSDRLRPLVAGLERADSITADFHKLWWQPIGASALLVRDPKWLAPLRHPSDYLDRPEDDDTGVLNLVSRSLDTSRRFDALKVLVSLRSTGRLRLAAMVEHLVETAAAVAQIIARHPELELLAPPSTVTVLFRWHPDPLDVTDAALDRANIAIQRTLFDSGQAILGRTRHRGRVALKLTLVNPHASVDDLTDLIELVAAGGRALPPARSESRSPHGDPSGSKTVPTRLEVAP